MHACNFVLKGSVLWSVVCDSCSAGWHVIYVPAWACYSVPQALASRWCHFSLEFSLDPLFYREVQLYLFPYIVTLAIYNYYKLSGWQLLNLKYQWSSHVPIGGCQSSCIHKLVVLPCLWVLNDSVVRVWMVRKVIAVQCMSYHNIEIAIDNHYKSYVAV